MSLEIDTDEMVKRGNQVQEYFKDNFGERVGMVLVLFNAEASSYHCCGSGRMILDQSLKLLLEVMKRTMSEIGPEETMRAIAEGMAKLHPEGGAFFENLLARNSNLFNKE
jgi:hypothetical protein